MGFLRRWPPWLFGVGAGIAAAAALAGTSRDFGLVWDEAYTIRRDRMLIHWIGLLRDAGSEWRQGFAEPVLDKYWRFSREEPDGHPPFYALLGTAGWHATRAWLPESVHRYRAGPIALWAATVGIAAWLLARRHGRAAAGVAALGLIAQPHLFAHAHYGHYDMPMTAFWLLSNLFFLEAARTDNWRWMAAFGVALGLGMATKFTGWFAVAAPVAWVILREWRSGPRPGWRTLCWGSVVAVAVLYAVQPPWWLRPLDGPWRFFASNLSRNLTTEAKALYFGAQHRFALPWHNTLVYVAICTPASLLALAAWGGRRTLFPRPGENDRRDDAILFLLSFGTLMVVRALPNAPGHDGVRLILPCLAVAAVAAGLGLAALPGRWRCAAAGLLALECGHGLATTYPYCLSYYSAAIGGVRGAERLGFEVTYYWDTLAAETSRRLAELRDRQPDRRLEITLPYQLVMLPYLKQFGFFPPGVAVQDIDPVTAPAYLLQRRFSAYSKADAWLERHATPLFSVRRGGVDLLRLYPYEALREAILETGGDLPPRWRR